MTPLNLKRITIYKIKDILNKIFLQTQSSDTVMHDDN